MTKTQYISTLIFLLIKLLSFNLSGQSVEQSIEQRKDSLIELIERATRDTTIANRYADLFHLYEHYRSNEAIEYARKSLSISKKIKYTDGKFKAYEMLFNQHFQIKSHPDSLLHYLKLMQSIQQTNERNLSISWSYGLYYGATNQLDKQIASFIQALDFLNMNDKKSITQRGLLLYNVGNTFFYTGKYSEALDYYNKSQALIDDEILSASILGSIGTAYEIGYNKRDTAQTLYKQAYQIYKAHSNPVGMVNMLLNQVEYQNLNTKFDVAYQLLTEASNLINENDINQLLYKLYQEFTAHYLLQRKYNLAIDYGEKALQEIEEKQLYIDYTKNTYEMLDESYKAIGNYRKGYETKAKFLIFNDSLKSLEQRNKVETIQTKLELEQQEIENKLLKAKQEQQDILLWIASIISILLAIIVYIIYRNNQAIKKSKQIIEQKNNELQALYNHKNQLFANISHELQTPLTLIMSTIRPMKGRNVLHNHVNSLQQVIRQILDLAKTDQKQLVVVNNRFLLKDFIQYIKVEFSGIARYRNIQYNVHSIIDNDFELKTDGYKLLTVVKNLLSNAFKFTPSDGKISINIIKDKNQQLTISVHDSGKGISKKDLPLVFNRYFQTTEKKTVVEGGMGIGLSICKEYIQLLGGTISVDSTEGKGSIFTIQFPAQLENLEIDETSSQQFNEYLGSITATDTSILTGILPLPTQISSTLRPSTAISDKMSVLVVEDNISMCQHLNTVLSPKYDVTFAPHGKKALELLEENYHPQLIISDLMMPEMDGFKFVNHLKADQCLKEIPVLMLTAREGIEDKMNAFRIGVDDYLTKPFLEEELHAHIGLLINNYQERKDYNAELTETTEKVKLEENNPSASSNTLPEEDKEWLDKFHEIILKHLDETNFSVNQLAAEMAISYSHIFREVKRLTGFTPYQYIKEVRLQEAKKMLESKKYRTVKAVVYKVGQTNMRHFTISFKKRFGKTPSEYLRD